MDAGESDACAEFRRRAFGAEFGRLKDGIESVERRAVLQTGIVVGGPPGGCPAKTYLFIDKEIEAEILKDAAHGRCGIQCPVAKSIDALARGTGASGAKSKVRIHLLRPNRRPGKRTEYQGGFQCGPQDWRQAASLVLPKRPRRRALLDGRSEEHTSELQSLRHLVCR